jgi:hypothetical protein
VQANYIFQSIAKSNPDYCTNTDSTREANTKTMFIEVVLQDQSESSEEASEDSNEPITTSKIQGSLCVAFLGI